METFGTKQKGMNYKTRYGAYAVFFENNKVAVIETKQGYFLPGGNLENDEETEQTVHREVLKELGWKLQILKSIGKAEQYFFTRKEKKYFQSVDLFYLAEKTGTSTSTSESNNHLHWLNPQEAIQKVRFESQAWAIQKAKLSR